MSAISEAHVQLATSAKASSVYCRVSWCLDSTARRYTAVMDPVSLASEITRAGADKVLEKNPKRIDDAAVNTVLKQGANALESGASKGTVDPAVGAAAEVRSRAGQTAEPFLFAIAISTSLRMRIRCTQSVVCF